MAYISDTGYSNALKLAAVKLGYCTRKIRSSLELDKASVSGQPEDLALNLRVLPFTIAIAAGLRVDHIEARLTSEVFEVLYPESM